MAPQRHQVKLSPRLGLGVGRSSSRGNLMPYATIIFLVISGVLAIRAGYMVIHRSPTQTPLEPQVLGAQDNPDQKPLFKEHVVKKGETVFSIGQQNNIEWTSLATINGLEAPFALQPGQILKIPQQ